MHKFEIMLSFRVPDINQIKNKENFDFSDTHLSSVLKELEHELCKSKSLLDEPYKNPKYQKITYLFESFNCEKEKIVKLSNNFNITNAWLKAYELVDHFDLIPTSIEKKNKYFHFDNAAFPGSFILAIHHFIESRTNIGSKYKWFASSLAIDTNEVKQHLEDKYCLHANYPNHWLMSPTNNGDLTVLENILDFEKRLPKVDLYTSDLGFDVSQNYNAQELLHLKAHYGQLLCGLLVLKPGGNLVVKQFTFFTEINICNLGILTTMFDEVYISKPATSKTDNSEIYIVAKGFKKNPEVLKRMKDMFFSCGENPDVLYSIRAFGVPFCEFIEKTSRILVKSQSDKIKLNVEKFYQILKIPPYENIYNASRKLFQKTREKELKEWYARHRIHKISVNKRLKMKDKFKQKRFLLSYGRKISRSQ